MQVLQKTGVYSEKTSSSFINFIVNYFGNVYLVLLYNTKGE